MRKIGSGGGAIAGDSCRRRRTGRTGPHDGGGVGGVRSRRRGHLCLARPCGSRRAGRRRGDRACAAVALGAVLLGSGERRSPFVRFMLLVRVLTGRPPGEYLPPESGER